MTRAAQPMTSALCVHIPMGWHPMVPVSWYQLDKQQQVIASGQAPLAELATQCAPQAMTVRLDSAWVLATQVALPPKSHAQRHALVPVLLEEQLLTSLDSNHFCLGHALPDGQIPVRVVDKAMWQQLFDTAQAAGFPIQAAWAEQDCLPVLTDASTVLIPAYAANEPLTDVMAFVRAPTGHLSVLWGEAPTIGASVQGSSSPVGEVFQRLPFNVRPNPDAVSLLQGAWAPPSWLGGGQWQVWRWSLCLLGLCVALWLASTWQQGRMVSQQVGAIRADMSVRFHAAFSGQPEVDALLQTRQAVGGGAEGREATSASTPATVPVFAQINTVTTVLQQAGVFINGQSVLSGFRATPTAIVLQFKTKPVEPARLADAFAHHGFRVQQDAAGLSWQLTMTKLS